MDEALVQVTAKRLVLDIWVGGSPIKVRAGVIINPPPIPKIDPRIPAPKPTITNKAGVVKESSKA